MKIERKRNHQEKTQEANLESQGGGEKGDEPDDNHKKTTRMVKEDSGGEMTELAWWTQEKARSTSRRVGQRDSTL